MKKKELIEKSIFVVSEYYRNNFEPFFDVISDDALWFGPRAGQVLQGRENIIKAWNSEENGLHFSMGNIEAMSTATGHSNLEVMLEYDVYTHFPNGRTDLHHQRLHYSWGNRTDPKVYMIHLSNISEGRYGQIYAKTHSDSASDAMQADIYTARIIYGKGSQGMTFYFNSLSILFIESTNTSRHTIVHTTEGTFTTIEPLKYYESNYSDVLLRAHAGYLINPLFVRLIRRFEVILADGTVLPVPEKKYTDFRKRLNEKISAEQIKGSAPAYRNRPSFN